MTRFFHRSRFSIGVVLLLSVVLVLSGCDDETLNAPEIEKSDNSETLFSSYVAIGNSLTAGMQSAGISSRTQHESYAVLLADSVLGTPFGVPSLAPPGCPPPFVRFFNEQGIPDPQFPIGTGRSTCALRSTSASPVHNVAVPDARVRDVLTNNPADGANPNPLNQFILGGRTQIQAALDAAPTFATIWIGNNDVFLPAFQGTTSVTSQSNFESNYTQMLDSLETADSLEGGVLIGVTNVTLMPSFSPGPVYKALEQAGQFPNEFNVASNCAKERNGLTPRVPLEYGFMLLGQAKQGQSVTLDCEAASSRVLTLNEVETIVQTVQQYNAFIKAQANQRGFAYFNPNGILERLYQDNNGTPNDPTDDLIPKFPDRDSDQPFGRFFSLDGVHPSAPLHRIITDELVRVIEAKYPVDLESLENLPAVPS